MSIGFCFILPRETQQARYIKGEKQDVIVECSLQWNAGFSEEVLPFTNNIHQKDANFAGENKRGRLLDERHPFLKEETSLQRRSCPIPFHMRRGRGASGDIEV